MSVLILRPNSASVTAQTATSVPNYTCVDEETLNEADHCYAPGSGSSLTLLDVYGFPDHSTETETINSVSIKAYCKKIVTGTNANNVTIRPAVRIGGTDYYGAAQNLTTSTALYTKSWTTNPATTEAWSWTNVDNLLAGDELTSNYINKNNYASSYCYQLWVEVDYGASGVGLPVFMFHYMNH